MTRSHRATILAANRKLLVEGDLDSVEQFFDTAYVAHSTGKRFAGGHAWIRRFVRELKSAFPDVRVEVEILAKDRDRVAWQRTFSGRQRGAYKGFPPTDRRIVWRDMVVSRFRDGRIAEEHVITDLAEQLLRARPHR